MTIRPLVLPLVAAVLAGGVLPGCGEATPKPSSTSTNPKPIIVATDPVLGSGGVPIEVTTGQIADDGTFEAIGALNPGQTLAVKVKVSAALDPSETLSFLYSASEFLDSKGRTTSAKWSEGTTVAGEPLVRIFKLGVVATFTGPNRTLTLVTTVETKVTEAGATRNQDVGRSTSVTFAALP